VLPGAGEDTSACTGMAELYFLSQIGAQMSFFWGKYNFDKSQEKANTS
jgi:hypothetical protein